LPFYFLSYSSEQAFVLPNSLSMMKKNWAKNFTTNGKKNHLLLENKKLNDYINQIGNLILAQSKKVPFEFHFSMWIVTQ